jgi:hypothetical protein
MLRYFLIFLFIIIVASQLFAQKNSTAFIGEWQSSFDISGDTNIIVIQIESEGGKHIGRLKSFNNLKDSISLNSIKITKHKISFSIEKDYPLYFKGILKSDSSIIGSLSIVRNKIKLHSWKVQLRKIKPNRLNSIPADSISDTITTDSTSIQNNLVVAVKSNPQFQNLSLQNNSVSSISATIVSEKQETIPFVNLFLKFSHKGTTCDYNGRFILLLDSLDFKDSIIFSSIGFQRRTLAVSDLGFLVASGQIILKEEINQLNEVVIVSKKQSSKRFGRRANNGISNFDIKADSINSFGFSNVYSIRKNHQYRVKTIGFHIKSINSNSDSIFFRVNFNRANSPNESFLNENIIVRIPSKMGWHSLNLDNYNVLLDSDFTVGVEVLPSEGSSIPISFSGQFGGTSIFLKNGVQYFTLKIASMSMYVDTTEYR